MVCESRSYDGRRVCSLCKVACEARCQSRRSHARTPRARIACMRVVLLLECCFVVYSRPKLPEIVLDSSILDLQQVASFSASWHFPGRMHVFFCLNFSCLEFFSLEFVWGNTVTKFSRLEFSASRKFFKSYACCCCCSCYMYVHAYL